MKFIKDLLFEMPQYVGQTNFGLDNEQVNKKFTRNVLLSKKLTIVKENRSENTILYKSGNRYILIDKGDNKTIYFVKFETQRYGFIGHPCVCQILVWRDLTNPKSTEVAKDIFFKYLINITGCIITDIQQTEMGQIFWFNRIRNALNNKLYVYYVNLVQAKGNNKKRELIEINSLNDLTELMKNKEIWGWPTRHQTQRLLISTTKIG